MDRKISIRTVALGLFCAFALHPVHAQNYPTKPIRILTASAGSGTDGTTRIISAQLEKRLGQTIVIENRAGAGPSVAAGVVAQAAPDGYTLLVFPNQITITPALTKDLPWDPVRDFAPIGRVGISLIAFGVRSDLSMKSLSDVIAYAKANPGRFRYGTSGVGSVHHLSMEYMAQAKGISIVHVPYTNTAAVITDAIGGRTEGAVSAINAMLPQSQAGKLRIVAIVGEKRSPLVPDAPIFQESGVEGVDAPWIGMLAPARTPPEIVTRLNRELNAVLGMPDVVEALAKHGTTVSSSTVAEFTAQVKSEVERWRKVVQGAGIKAE